MPSFSLESANLTSDYKLPMQLTSQHCIRTKRVKCAFYSIFRSSFPKHIGNPEIDVQKSAYFGDKFHSSWWKDIFSNAKNNRDVYAVSYKKTSCIRFDREHLSILLIRAWWRMAHIRTLRRIEECVNGSLMQLRHGFVFRQVAYNSNLQKRPSCSRGRWMDRVVGS